MCCLALVSFQQYFNNMKTVSGSDRGFNAKLAILRDSILCATSLFCLSLVSNPSHVT